MLTNFPNGITSFGNLVFGSLGIGNVYYVVNTNSTTTYTDLKKRFGGERYEDGSAILYPHTATASTVTLNGLKNALAATVEDRNDYVVVMGSNSTYYIDEALALNKKNVHIICPAGMGYDRGATNAARIQQITASTAIFAVSDASVEIAGFYLKNINSTAAITLASTAWLTHAEKLKFTILTSETIIKSCISLSESSFFISSFTKALLVISSSAVYLAVAAFTASCTAGSITLNL
jgi:hypothetical protein